MSFELAIQLRWLLCVEPRDIQPFLPRVFDALRPPILWPSWCVPVFLEVLLLFLTSLIHKCILRQLTPENNTQITTLFNYADCYLTSALHEAQLVGLLFVHQLLQAPICAEESVSQLAYKMSLQVAHLTVCTTSSEVALAALDILRLIAPVISPVTVLLYSFQVIFIETSG